MWNARAWEEEEVWEEYCCLVTQSCLTPVTPWTAALQASLSFTVSQNLLKLISTDSVIPSHHLILCHPLLFLTSIFPSIRVFSNESALHIRWPEYWSLSFSISPSNECSGLISLGLSGLIFLLSKRLSEPSPAPQFESISSSTLSLLSGPTLISIHDY